MAFIASKTILLMEVRRMATELVWYEVIDLTSYVVKYPDYAHVPCYIRHPWNSINMSLGKYSTKEPALIRLKSWADENGLSFEKNTIPNPTYPYYEDDYSVTCECVLIIGINYDPDGNQVSFDDPKQAYMIGAQVVKKHMTLDKG